MDRDTLLLIDGHSLVYRAFFAMPALTNSRGEVTNAAYGFTSMLLKALGDHRPTHAVAAFDPPGRTFRHEQDETYKAGRKPMPEDLIPQFPWCREVVEALGIPIIEVPTFEADDVIGTLSAQGERAGLDVIIVTGDLDALQLVTDRVRVFANRRGISDTIVYDVERVYERYGFAPPYVVDFKSLRGDVSDNIPGVPGIGDKTAMTLVQEHGPLEAILEAVPSMKEGKVKRLLTEYEQQARLSKQLATIDMGMQIALDLDASRLGPPDDEAVRAVFDRLEFRSLLGRIPTYGVETASSAPSPSPQGVLNLDSLPAAVDVEVIDSAAAAEDMVQRLRERGDVVLRSIIDGTARRGDVTGVALASFDAPDPAYYIPVGHEQGNADEQVVVLLSRLLEDPSVVKHGYDLKQELLAWGGRGVALASLGFDAMLAAYLCITTRTRVPALTVLAHDLCGLTEKPEEGILGSGRGRRSVSVLPVEEAASYYGTWVSMVPPVVTALHAQLAEGTLHALFDDLEMPLVPILATMERVGIRVDCDELARLSAELYQRIGELEATVAETAGYTFNPGSTQQLATFLYDNLGLAAGRRTKTGRSTDADSLESLRGEHPVVDVILEWRQLTKLKSTYVDALPLLCAVDGRVHTSFNQAVAATGRLSSADPNLQNVPVRTEWGQRIRHAFVADPGHQLVSADYSQIELRVLAHVSGEEELIAAFERGEDIHRRTAAEVYDVPPERVTPDQRRIAKVVNFGVVYGLSDFGLARDTGMDQEVARAFIEKYFASFPAVTRYLERTRMHAREWGWVETFLGRRRHLADIRAANRQLRGAAERMAVNMPIQGAAADIMKLAMIRFDRALREAGGRSRLLLQVHDELVLESPDDEVEEVVPMLCDAMGGAADLVVPLVVDVKVGINWQEMTPLRETVSAGAS
ncbi:MAG: DNA polymerase I [Candidatus Dormibacteraeota bacterium]|uniref:DNA polymerase I n=1 Tax=Candidatus Amunia macphersoniae TaxID=3127014 RepID=A0A934KME8_9BACT|nr:DNA polymerase I [Candidatus Dormibacteraeota bacterium]